MREHFYASSINMDYFSSTYSAATITSEMQMQTAINTSSIHTYLSSTPNRILESMHPIFQIAAARIADIQSQ